ncbi:hypothetical protein BGX21_004456 [Mortierella sp. AD011]|nr:hypothetical protein BGX20_003785 [Mortierella sp. AD010]KAF9403414.1 hypothetical protein BGX21_004456 [Mortierella sp. AD011]
MSSLSPAEVADLKESFDAFDRNNDGSISRRELHSLLHTVGHKVNSHGLENYLTEFDVDQSGTIDFEEFLSLANRLIKNKSANFSEEEVASFKECFDAFDRNGDGSISASELRSLLRIVGAKYGGSAVGDTMAEFDTNHDQHIDFNEFLMLVDKLTKNKTP